MVRLHWVVGTERVGVLLGVAVTFTIVFAILIVAPLAQRNVLWIWILLGTALFSQNLVDLLSGPPRTNVQDIGAEVPALTSIDVAIIVLGVLTFRIGVARPNNVKYVVPALIGFAVLGIFVWPHRANIAEGILHLTIGLVAWVVGARFGRESHQNPSFDRGVAGAVMMFVLLQTIVCAVQLVTGTTGPRASGTFSHPSVVGKIFLILFAVVLPLTVSPDKRTRRFANIGIALGVVCTAMTLSRANIVGVVGAVLLWFLMTNAGAGARSRLLLSGGVAALAALPFASALVERFSRDEAGGDRPELLAAGLRVISNVLFTGTGPNNYVEFARVSEPIVWITGYPVHNTTLLIIAECGIVVGLLVLVPLLRTVLTAASAASRRREQSGDGRALVIVAFMIFAVSWTGWGFLQAPVLEICYFVFGYAFGRIRALQYEARNAANRTGSEDVRVTPDPIRHVGG